MNKKGQSNTMILLIILFVTIILGISLITSVANTKAKQTNLMEAADEITDLSATGCLVPALGHVNESNALCNITAGNWYSAGDWRLSASPCYLTSVVVGNATDDLTVNTDYIVYDESGIVQMLNTTDTHNSSIGNVIYEDYSFCDSGYLTSAGDRGLANLWVTMMVLVLLIVAIMVGMKLLNDR